MKTEIVKSREDIKGTLNTVIAELETARDQVRAVKVAAKEDNKDEAKLKVVMSVTGLTKKLDGLKATQKVVDMNVEYFKHISKYGKAIAKALNPAIEDASYQLKLPSDTINRVSI